MIGLLRIAAGAVAAMAAAALILPMARAQPSAGQGGSCFLLSEIQGTRLVGMRTLYIRAGSGAIYRMDFSADCNDVGDEPLILHPVDNDDQICSAIQLNVSVRHTGGLCNAVSLRRLRPDEVAAIARRDLP